MPTKENPADLATRGATSSSIQSNELWWKGPPWLNHENAWPPMPDNTEVHETPVVALIAAETKYKGILSDELEKKFSSWDTYIRFFRFWECIRHKCNGLPIPNEDVAFKHGEESLIREVQKKYFPRELRLLTSKKPVQPNIDLELFLDEKHISYVVEDVFKMLLYLGKQNIPTSYHELVLL